MKIGGLNGSHEKLLSLSACAPPLGSLSLLDIVLDDTGGTIGALTHFVTVEVFELRANGPVHEVVLACKSILTRFAEWVELVTPVAPVMEPFRWGGGGECGRPHILIVEVIGVGLRVEERIP